MSTRFKHLYIEITNVCNLHCPFCPQDTTRIAHYMDSATFERIVAQVAPYTKYLYLHVKGEPLLHPELSTLLAIVAKYDLMVNITTNGVMLNHLSELLLHADVINKINVSLQALIGMDAKKRAEYLNNLVTFIKKHQIAPRVGLNLRFWNDKTKVEVKKLIDEVKGVLQSNFGVTKFEDKKPILPKVYYSAADEFCWPTLAAPDNLLPSSCLGGKTHLAILVNGQVTLCCLDEMGIINLGNLTEQPFAEILMNPDYQKALVAFQNQQAFYPLCQKCTYRLRFLNKKD